MNNFGVKVIIVLLSLLIADLLVKSCSRCPEYQLEYSLSSFSAIPLNNEKIMKVIGGAQYAGENNPYPFRTDFGVSFLFQCPKNIITIAEIYQPVQSLFIQSAYAWSCEPAPNYYPIDRIISIQIFSDKDFGQTHLAGTDIAELFTICEWNYVTRVLWLTSLEDYLKRSAPILHDSDSIRLDCLITAMDVEHGEHNFRFVVKLSDGRILEQSITGVLE